MRSRHSGEPQDSQRENAEGKRGNSLIVVTFFFILFFCLLFDFIFGFFGRLFFIKRRRFPLLRSTHKTKRLSRMESGCTFVDSASSFKSYFLILGIRFVSHSRTGTPFLGSLENRSGVTPV